MNRAASGRFFIGAALLDSGAAGLYDTKDNC